MSNFFDYKNDDTLSLHLSNLRSGAFMELLVISGSRLCTNNRERDLITFIAEKDQSKVGLGNIGFDVCEMPWNIKTFPEEKEFLLKVCDCGANGLGWDSLSYEPNPEVVKLLHTFKTIISAIEAEDIDENFAEEWRLASRADEPRQHGYPYCAKHNIITTTFGCIICNYEGEV